MPPETSPTIQCKQCDYVNEPERVYCHNCGTKLDRSVLPREEHGNREGTDQARRRIKRMTNPRKNVLARELKSFLQVIVLSFLAAFLFQILRTPDDAPGEFKKTIDETIPMISIDFSDAIDAPALDAARLH